MVEFDLLPGGKAAFLELITRNARQSLDLEEGCLVFDVLVKAQQPERIVLYECYSDRRSFELHCQSPHFLAFDAASRPLVARKSLVEFERIELPEMA